MHLMTEIFGYLATLMLAISLMVTKELKFRIINSLGCLSFIIYGLLLKAGPIVVTNSLLLAINMFYLVKILKRKEDFDIVFFEPDNELVQKFVQFYQKDFSSYYPNYENNAIHADIRLMVLRDMNIANIFMAKRKENGLAEVLVNYTTPKYRDYKIGKYLFEAEKLKLKNLGISKLYYADVAHKGHIEFLRKNGFTQGPGETEFIKTL